MQVEHSSEAGRYAFRGCCYYQVMYYCMTGFLMKLYVDGVRIHACKTLIFHEGSQHPQRTTQPPCASISM